MSRPFVTGQSQRNDADVANPWPLHGSWVSVLEETLLETKIDATNVIE